MNSSKMLTTKSSNQEPSIWKGIARVLDLFGIIDNHEVPRNSQQKDSDALEDDWQAVGNDLKYAISRYSNQQTK